RHLLRWCLEVAGRRVHGTIKQIPLELFDRLERPALLPLPLSPWELAEWKQAQLHADCPGLFAGASYPPPHPLRGARLWVRCAAAACSRAHAVGAYRYHTIKAILVHALDRQPLPALAPLPTPSPGAAPRHARPWTTFFPDPEAEDRRSPAWN